tara:strand:+ start:257 stop:889 length:633 start_codon:yes stop_codon:yes gene_type:complete
MYDGIRKEKAMAQEPEEVKGLEQYGEVTEGILMNVEQETGTTDRGDWVLYRLILDDGQEYSQFASNEGLPPKDTQLETVQKSYAASKEKDEYLRVKLAYQSKGQYKNVTAIIRTGMATKEDLPKEVLSLDKYMKPRHPQDVIAMTYVSSYERAIALFSDFYPNTAPANADSPMMLVMNEIDEVAEHIANTVLTRSGYREEDKTEQTEVQD